MKSKRILSTTITGSLVLMTLGSCAVKKDYVEVPTNQMPSKHIHEVKQDKKMSYMQLMESVNSNDLIEERLKQVYFDFDSSNLANSEVLKVISIAKSLKELSPEAKIMITGHTDQIGSKKYNKQLGFERAQTVRGILIKEGVKPEILEIKSFGENNPKVKTSDLAEMDVNRRVSFKI